MNEFKITWDDLPEELKELVDIGIYTKAEALERYTGYSNACGYCEDLDWLSKIVCYVPIENEHFKDRINIPVNYCPVCGRKLDE